MSGLLHGLWYMQPNTEVATWTREQAKEERNLASNLSSGTYPLFFSSFVSHWYDLQCEDKTNSYKAHRPFFSTSESGFPSMNIIQWCGYELFFPLQLYYYSFSCWCFCLFYYFQIRHGERNSESQVIVYVLLGALLNDFWRGESWKS